MTTVDISNVVLFDGNPDIKDESPIQTTYVNGQLTSVDDQTRPATLLPTELVVKRHSAPCQISLVSKDFEKCMCDSDHEFIIDWIDIDPDKSQQIVYCKFCYLEG